ncbi:hypothetical protein GWI33_004285 [Rhynchophorus ferrugineus]|uniref:Uncharacterized protein n=1 Tax=Rhynchophorus ferrugineus TaxID=354439 RepID=A0A834IPP2_RHYFE|nr:hypothetical protein GWI33_004285 [Rhynchophorus ferrugineus]
MLTMVSGRPNNMHAVVAAAFLTAPLDDLVSDKAEEAAVEKDRERKTTPQGELIISDSFMLERVKDGADGREMGTLKGDELNIHPATMGRDGIRAKISCRLFG